MPDLYAVIGNPIAHSKSPQIHQAFARQTEQDLHYEAVLGDKDDFAASVDAFRQRGGKGMNVTVPFKLDAYDFADDVSQRGRRAAAVNTLIFQGDGKVLADNTDGVGLVRDITVNQQTPITGKRVLLLGAGGACRGVLAPLLAEQPERIVIANRTESRAEELAKSFADLGAVSGCGFAGLSSERFDVIINGTSAGLSDEVPPLPEDALNSDGFCYDMVYANEPTAFVRWAMAHGAAKAVDGLGMLVEQAAESFLLWRGVRPQTADVMAMLRG